MNRVEYICELEGLLASLPAKEREEVLYDIREHFEAALSQGKAEDDIIKTLGTPGQVAGPYVQQCEQPYVPYAPAPSGRSVVGYATTVVGLGFVTLSIIFPLMVSWAAVVFSLVVTGMALVLGGLAALLALSVPGIFSGMNDNGFSWTINILAIVALLSFGGIWTVLSLEFASWNFRWMKTFSVALGKAFTWNGGGKV